MFFLYFKAFPFLTGQEFEKAQETKVAINHEPSEYIRYRLMYIIPPWYNIISLNLNKNFFFFFFTKFP